MQAVKEAEMSLLGSLILDSRHFRNVGQLVKPSDFLVAGHGILFGVIATMYQKGVDVDLVTLRNELGSKIQECGGMGYLMELAEYVPSASNAAHYAGIVREASIGRQIADKCRAVLSDVERDECPSVLASKLSSEFSKLSQNALSKKIQTITEVAVAYQDQLLDEKPVRTHTTGFPSLDAVIGGFCPGDQIVVGAYSGMGKTSFLLESIVQTVTKNPKYPAVIFSAEMTAKSLLSRFIQAHSGVSVFKQRNGGFTADEYQKMSDVMESVYKLPIIIIDSGDMSPKAIRGYLDQVQDKFGNLGIFAVDYIGMVVKSGTMNRAAAVEDFCFECKGLAKEFDCTSFLLSQLSRESVKGDNGKPPPAPRLTDLKESGGIEASADVVIGLHRPEYWASRKEGRKEQKAPAFVHVVKNRFGGSDVVELEFTPWQARWHEKGK